jgi:RimJ/RimL family protein N-acetyltransferase
MNSAASSPAYRIHTRRLVLRCWQPEDAPLLKAAADSSLDHLRPWMPWAHQEPTNIEAKVAFEVDKVERVGIHCDRENHASAAVARKSGFAHEETMPKETADDRVPVYQMIWVMHIDAYPASPAAEAGAEAFDAIGRRLL